jgi:hypothetical protein
VAPPEPAYHLAGTRNSDRQPPTEIPESPAEEEFFNPVVTGFADDNKLEVVRLPTITSKDPPAKKEEPAKKGAPPTGILKASKGAPPTGILKASKGAPPTGILKASKRVVAGPTAPAQIEYVAAEEEEFFSPVVTAFNADDKGEVVRLPSKTGKPSQTPGYSVPGEKRMSPKSAPESEDEFFNPVVTAFDDENKLEAVRIPSAQKAEPPSAVEYAEPVAMQHNSPSLAEQPPTGNTLSRTHTHTLSLCLALKSHSLGVIEHLHSLWHPVQQPAVPPRFSLGEMPVGFDKSPFCKAPWKPLLQPCWSDYI